MPRVFVFFISFSNSSLSFFSTFLGSLVFISILYFGAEMYFTFTFDFFSKFDNDDFIFYTPSLA